jgi:hypothetical protein
VSQGLPLLITAFLYGAAGILLLVITGDKNLRGIMRMIRKN